MRILKVILVIMVVSCMTTIVFAQGRKMEQGLNRNSVGFNNGMNIKLDVINTIMFEGKITKIETVKLWNYSRGSIQLTVKDKAGIKLIQMGPEFYFVENKILFKTGDKLKGIAYKGTSYNKSYLFAVNIDINGSKIVLRDKNGVPVWKKSRRYKRSQVRSKMETN